MIFAILRDLSDEARAELEAFIRAEVERLFGERVLLTVEQFSVKSGLSQKAIYHRVERRQIQFVRNGGRILIPATELRRRT